MQKLEFKTTINATREKVWDVLWDKTTYREWTSVFSPGSDVQTNWGKGDKVIFGDGSGNGMVSEIAENKPNEFMSFRHLGEMKDGVEDTTSEKVKAWAGSMENYTLKEADGKTELMVEIDIADEYKDMFSDMFPKALQKVKEMAEKNG